MKITNIEAFSKFKRNFTSQSGEDGILQELFKRLAVDIGWCVEFGAWDGVTLSNTWSLWHEKGWQAALIEGDPQKAELLNQNVEGFQGVHALNSFVSHTGPTRLDRVLASLPIPPDFELLSVDVDGDDYHIWNGVRKYQPKVVVIEFNSSIPPHMSYIDKVKSPMHVGSSAKALLDLAHQKGYQLAACTATNLIFVETAHFTKLDTPEPELIDVFPYDRLTNVISSNFGFGLLTNKRPTHIRVSEFEGIRNQIRVPIVDQNSPFEQVIIIARHGDQSVNTMLKTIIEFPWALRFATRIRAFIRKLKRELLKHTCRKRGNG
ncbi:MAG: hypothetical protein DWG76_02275 [Chloroflexi bacterium]|nr:hypothetical protein [Chloroflexota bacterium]